MGDSDGSGFIDGDELRDLMVEMAWCNDVKISEEEINQVMNLIDKDSNGEISEVEFVNWVITSLHEEVEQGRLTNKEVKAAVIDAHGMVRTSKVSERQEIKVPARGRRSGRGRGRVNGK